MRNRITYEARIDDIAEAIKDSKARIRTAGKLSREDRLLLKKHLAILHRIHTAWQRAHYRYAVKNLKAGSPSESGGVRAQRDAVVAIRTILKAARRRLPNS